MAVHQASASSPESSTIGFAPRWFGASKRSMQVRTCCTAPLRVVTFGVYAKQCLPRWSVQTWSTFSEWSCSTSTMSAGHTDAAPDDDAAGSADASNNEAGSQRASQA